MEDQIKSYLRENAQRFEGANSTCDGIGDPEGKCLMVLPSAECFH